jgi:biopolymer transport protein TolR
MLGKDMAFGRFPRAAQAKPFSDINVTPLVDVMLVLLVIFILTAPLLTSAIRLDLPQSKAAQAGEAPEALSLSLKVSGELFINDKPVTLAALPTQLQQLANQKPNLEVQLRVDQAVPYGQVLELMSLAQLAGLSRIGFVTAPGTDAQTDAQTGSPRDIQKAASR